MTLQFLTIAFLSLTTTAQLMAQLSPKAAADKWVDDTYNAMSDTARMGQLIMVRAHSNLGEDHIQKVMEEIKTYGVGGLCFFQGTPEKQANLTNQYQKLSKVPLFVSMDAEWGLRSCPAGTTSRWQNCTANPTKPVCANRRRQSSS